jgi:hypothetical protein
MLSVPFSRRSAASRRLLPVSAPRLRRRVCVGFCPAGVFVEPGCGRFVDRQALASVAWTGALIGTKVQRPTRGSACRMRWCVVLGSLCAGIGNASDVPGLWPGGRFWPFYPIRAPGHVPGVTWCTCNDTSSVNPVDWSWDRRDVVGSISTTGRTTHDRSTGVNPPPNPVTWEPAAVNRARPVVDHGGRRGMVTRYIASGPASIARVGGGRWGGADPPTVRLSDRPIAVRYLHAVAPPFALQRSRKVR